MSKTTKTKQTEEPKNEEQPQVAAASTAIEVKGSDGKMVAFDYGQYAGAGSTDLPTSGRINYLNIIQSSSKALKKGNEKYNPDARASMMSLGEELIDGDEGVYFVGIEKQHVLVEITKTDGTGERVAEHDPNGELAKKCREEFGPNKFDWRSPDGNFIVESIRLVGVRFASKEDMDALKPLGACIIDFQKTKLAAWDKISSSLMKIPAEGRPPMFAVKMKITTKLENRKGHDYYNFSVKFSEGDDFLRSLISPQHEKWQEWAKQCTGVAKGFTSGSLTGDEENDVSQSDGEENIPF